MCSHLEASQPASSLHHHSAGAAHTQGELHSDSTEVCICACTGADTSKNPCHRAQSHLLLVPEACTAVELAQIRFEQRSSIRRTGWIALLAGTILFSQKDPQAELACSAARSADSCYFGHKPAEQYDCPACSVRLA